MFKAVKAITLMALFSGLTFSLTGALAQPVPDAGLPPGVQRVTTVEGVSEYTLPNGLHVLLLQDSSKPTTTVNLTVKVGSRHESYGETGMAHLLEHLMFKGTPRHPEVWSEFTKRGLRANGTTSFDRTNYFASFGENADTLDWYLDWLADALVNSNIARADLDTEMTVVRNEMERGENSADRILWEKVMAVAFQWHNYGKATIGARSDVENVEISNLQAFYRKYYQPDNAVVIVGGKFDPAKVLAIVAQRFGGIAKPSRILTPSYTLDPTQDGERSVTLRRNGGTPGLLAAYHIPPAAHPDFGALRLAATILGGPNARLHKALVDTGLAAEAGSWVYGLAEPGMAYFSADLKSDQDLERARVALLDTVEGTARAPIRADELERARNFLINGIEKQMLDPERVAISLSDSIANGDWRLYFLNRDRIRDAKLEDVQRVANTWLLTDNRTLGRYIPTATPQRAPAPARVEVAALVKDYKGNPTVASGEVFDPSPDNIDRRTARGSTPAAIQYALLPKQTRGGIVNVVLRFGLGDEKSLFNRSEAGAAMAGLLGRGSAVRNREAVQTEFDRLKTQWGISGSAHGIAVGLQSTRANLPAALELVAELLRKPAFSASEFEQVRNARIAGLEAQLSEPEAILGSAIERHGNPYPKGDLRYAPTMEEAIASLKAVKLQDAKEFYDEFYGAQAAQVSAVGDFDADALKAQLDRLFADWKSRQSYVRVTRPHIPVAPLALRFNTPDKANATLQGVLTFPLRESDPDYPALYVANRIFGAGGASRLWRSIREKQGLSYSVYSYLDGGLFNANMGWNVGAIFAPANVDKVKASFTEELQRALREGFTASELAEATRGLLQSRALARAQEPGLAQTLSLQTERGITMKLPAEIERKIAALTLDEVNAAFRKYIRPENLVLGVAGAFNKP
jgi:zinc protease